MRRLIRDHHDAQVAAHAGVKKTQQWIRKHYYWPNLHRDVEDYVLSCDRCARWKTGRVTTAPMGYLPEAREPGEVASIDITGPYATSRRGNRYLLTYVDHFTKWAEAVPLPDKEAATVADALVMQIFARHGVCDKLLSDRGRNFTSELLRETCRLLGVKKLFTSPYRPQGNGQVERFHRTLHAGLAMYANPSGTNWDDHLNLVLWAYRSQPHSSTGYSPYHLTHGAEMKGPTDRELAAYERKRRRETGVKGHLARLAGQLRRARQAANRKLAGVRQRQHERHDLRARRIEYRPGQLVYRKQMVKGRKLEPKWLGPYQVLKKISDLVYTIQVGKKEVNVHVEQLKLCRASREELRERRKQNRQRRREWRPQQVREDSESSSSDSSSEEGGSEPLHSSKSYERRGVNEYNRRRSGSVPTKDGTASRNDDSSDSESEDGDDWPLYRYAQNESHSRTERDSRVSKNAAAAEEADTRANAQREGLDSNEQDSQISGNVSAVEETETEQTAERDANSAVGNVDASADHPPRASESTEGQHGYTLRPRPQRNYKE